MYKKIYNYNRFNGGELMKVDYKNDIESVLLSEEKLKEIVKSLGKQISDDYRDSGRKLLLVSVF